MSTEFPVYLLKHLFQCLYTPEANSAKHGVLIYDQVYFYSRIVTKQARLLQRSFDLKELNSILVKVIMD